jgi:hypothetical protein
MKSEKKRKKAFPLFSQNGTKKWNDSIKNKIELYRLSLEFMFLISPMDWKREMKKSF